MKILQCHLKSKDFIWMIGFFLILGMIIKIFPDFTLWTISSPLELVSEGQRVFYSIHSMFTMTFLILPIYICWIMPHKSRNAMILEATRYPSPDAYIRVLFWHCFIESLTYAIFVFLTFFVCQIPNFQELEPARVVMESINTCLGFFVIDLIGELLILLFRHRTAPVGILIAIICLEYFLFLQTTKSGIVCPLLAPNAESSLFALLFNTVYAIFLILLLYCIFSAVYRRKSLF